MNKLKLTLESLAVESFDTTASQKARGTVFGEQCTCYTVCTCPGCPSCDATCAYTCDDVSCAGTCGHGNSCQGSCAMSCECTDFGGATCGCPVES